MKKVTKLAWTVVAVAAAAGCHRPSAVRSVAKPAPASLPGGTLTLAFTRRILGPLELSLDGVRVPVQQGKKGGKSLVVTGIPEGRHRYFIQSNRDAFGPDQGDLDMTAAKGVYYVVFTQRFEAVLYGKPEAIPPAEGIPGVRAELR